jgi:hypothetical protein
MLDLRADRQHPRKRNRRLANGALPLQMAIVLTSFVNGTWQIGKPSMAGENGQDALDKQIRHDKNAVTRVARCAMDFSTGPIPVQPCMPTTATPHPSPEICLPVTPTSCSGLTPPRDFFATLTKAQAETLLINYRPSGRHQWLPPRAPRKSVWNADPSRVLAATMKTKSRLACRRDPHCNT